MRIEGIYNRLTQSLVVHMNVMILEAWTIWMTTKSRDYRQT